MKPKISIITVTYNCETLIRKTILSVLNQTYSNIEYIIIDGASKDKTVAIAQEYKTNIAKIVSEPDKGLYDAMNKAIQLATGDFIWFMNAGDYIHNIDTVEQMISYYSPETDILYGEVAMISENGKSMGTRSEITTQKLPENLNWKSLKYGMVVSHQAFIPRLAIVDEYIPNNLSADIDWVISALKKSKKNTFIPMILADYLMGGTSKQQHKTSLIDRFKVLQKHYGFIPNLFHHKVILLRAIFYKITKRVKY